ncbi:MAG TPA: NAD(+) synthase [Methanocella sp.]|jgi:NAD+ synthase
MTGAEKSRGPSDLENCLQLDLEATRREIVDFVRHEVERFGRDGVLVGFSGGLDSSTVGFLCKEALGADRVYGLILPERDSSRRNMEDAEKIVRLLGIKYEKIDITPVLEDIGVYDVMNGIPIGNRTAVEGMLGTMKRVGNLRSPFAERFGAMYAPDRKHGLMDRTAQGISNRVHAFATAKTRVRMIELYFHAILKNFLLAGTTDLSEWRIGFYDKYGDAASDISLLKHLYKTQIRALARHIGVPDYIIDKPSSGDLMGEGLPNETAIGMSYETLDRILCGMDRGLPDAAIVEAVGVPIAMIEIVKKAIEGNKVRESMPFAPGTGNGQV